MNKTILAAGVLALQFAAVRGADVSGELKQWHTCTLTFEGPESAEDALPNPFADFRLLVEYVPGEAEKVLEISPRHGRAEILASVQFLVDHGF